MKNSKLFKSIAALSLSLAMVLSGCANGGQPNKTSGSGGSTSGEQSTVNSTAPSKKTLRVATNWEKTTFDPALWGDAAGIRAGISMFETLAFLDNDSNIVPSLAESWEISEDEKTYTFHLRKGVQFHGGYGEFTSADVVYTFERLKDPAVGATESKSRAKFDNIELMDATDPYTFILKLKEVDYEILMDFASWNTFIVSKKAGEELGASGLGARPVGTGPYEYEAGKPAESYSVVRFEDYWGEKPAIERITVTTLPDEVSAVNAFNAGEVDLTTITDPNNIKKFKTVEGSTVTRVSDFQSFYLGFNMTVEPFNNPKVREAMKYVINYDEMINVYWEGTMLPPQGYVSSDALYAAPATATGFTFEYNLEKAKQLLAEAGYPNGFSTSVAAPNDSMSKGPLMVIQQYLAEAGIDMKLNLTEFPTFITDVRAGNYEMWFLANGDGYRGDTWLRVFTTEKLLGSNWCGFSNTEYDELVAKAQTSKTSQEKQKYYFAAQQILVDNIPSIPIAESCTHILSRNNVKNISLDPSHLFQYRYMDIE